ncbi:hypothetical protein ACIBCM_18585 [Streptomyces sp. NPDC051018]|uniref:hypothetical protein n=1 Tax=Streptomyces sp. NPDC051018 TaxID=3365639 RepID=UPI00379325C6
MTSESLTADLPPAGAETCCHCGRSTTAPVEVRRIESASADVPGVTLYACPDDAVLLHPGPIPGECGPGP